MYAAVQLPYRTTTSEKQVTSDVNKLQSPRQPCCARSRTLTSQGHALQTNARTCLRVQPQPRVLMQPRQADASQGATLLWQCTSNIVPHVHISVVGVCSVPLVGELDRSKPSEIGPCQDAAWGTPCGCALPPHKRNKP